MNQIDVSRIDLNLLATLDALLREGGVTAAARRLGIGQPAASHALSRLRALFGDPLLVRTGREMVPTPRAEALREPLRRVLSDVARLVQQEPGFDPEHSTRSFVLICPDLLAPILPAIMATLQAEVPQARLVVRGPGLDLDTALERGQADIALGPGPAEGAGLYTRGLGTLHWVVVGRRGHPSLRSSRKLSVRRWCGPPHVIVETGSGSRSIVGAALERSGHTRRIGLVVPSFMAALVALTQTDLLLTAPRELIAPLLPQLQLVTREPPIEIPGVPVAALWHERYIADPAHQFFRALVVDQLERSLRGG